MIFNIARNRFCSLRLQRCFCKSAETNLVKQLHAHIKLNGPLTVAKYMREALTNPTAGYYMHKDVFGTKGDFTTSPEISQMFGELIGIWCVTEWIQSGSPPKIQIVELGPGRGTLADDMMRVFTKFEALKNAASFHLVEVSPKLSQLQMEKLCDTKHYSVKNEAFYQHGRSKDGTDVFWYNDLQDVSHGMAFYVAHEFFDALPIHKFQKRDGKWKEVLIDIDDTEAGAHHLRYTLAPGDTYGARLIPKTTENSNKSELELSLQSGVIVEDIAARIAKHGGFSLIADYGHNGEKTDTLRAFKQHALHEPLSEPGLADLTADVDFSYLNHVSANANVSTFGPETQDKFLHNMGIGMRMQVLMMNADTEQRKNLITGYDMMTNHKKMGERFKFFSICQKRDADYLPAGFKPIQ